MTDRPEAEKLETCPFCGKAPYAFNHHVSCSCGCALGELYNGDEGIFDSNAEAIAAWNRRAPAQPVADAGGVTADILAELSKNSDFAKMANWLGAIRDIVREAHFATDDSEDRSHEEPAIHCVPHRNFVNLSTALEVAESFAGEDELWDGPAPLVTRVIEALQSVAAATAAKDAEIARLREALAAVQPVACGDWCRDDKHIPECEKARAALSEAREVGE